MHPEVHNILEKVLNAVNVVHEDSYYTAKHADFNEIKYAIDALTYLCSSSILDKQLKSGSKTEIREEYIEALITAIAAYKLEQKISLIDFGNY